MRPPPPPDEGPRLAELRSLGLLDSGAEERFDRVTRLAQRLFDVPIALVSLVDDDRQWFKSRQGLDATETSRDVSFCGYAIHGDEVMHVADATLDPRFAENPLVLGDPGIRFYAGAPIAGPRGHTLGTLCIIDRQSRPLTEEDAASLRDLAEMVEREIAATHLATIDELTGLSNRRGFVLLGSKLIDVCVRRSLPASVLYVDLDGLKLINDRLGHHEGDAALREFGLLLESTFRTSDVVARLGGDEFAVLFTGTQGSQDLIARLTRALAERNATSQAPYQLGASIGCAPFDPGAPVTIDELVQLADVAMYRMKEERRRS